MKTVEIPENWTGKEAIVVYDFLADMMEAIWERYDDKMVELLMHEEDNPADLLDCLEPEDSFDDEIPF
jgi:hypothetical protein